jgi:predicted RNA binding protein YcfA (HicA-like mRNA interferase family)
MSPKLPVLSGEELVRILEKFGYVRVRQKESHVRLRHSTEAQRKSLTVPLHKTLKRDCCIDFCGTRESRSSNSRSSCESAMPKCGVVAYWSEEDRTFMAEVPELPWCEVDERVSSRYAKHSEPNER